MWVMEYWNQKWMEVMGRAARKEQQSHLENILSSVRESLRGKIQ